MKFNICLAFNPTIRASNLNWSKKAIKSLSPILFLKKNYSSPNVGASISGISCN